MSSAKPIHKSFKILEVSQMTSTIILQNEEEMKKLSNKELLLAVKNLNMPTKSMSKFIKNNHHNPVLDEVISRTNFLDETVLGFIPILARLYCLEHNLTSHPECQNPECDHKVEWRNGLHKFAPYCSVKCRDTDQGFQEKKQKTLFERHGVRNCMELYWVKDKIKKTNLDRRGVEYATQSPEVKEKTRQTCLERHGVECVLQLESVKKKGIETSIKNWGVEHPSQAEEIKQRVKQTFKNNYGVDHPMQSEEVKAKVANTMLKKHGVECAFQLDSVRQKLIDSNMDKHGVKSMLELPEVRELGQQQLIDKYGVDSPSKLDWVKEKIKNAHLSDETYMKTIQTSRERYGVDWYMQTSEFHKNSHKRYTHPKYPDMSWATSWEFKVYDFLTENNIPFEYQIEPIPYEYDGGIHYYHPDFRVNGRIFEVKGDNFFRINEETGKKEMYMTWRKPGMTDEEYKKSCEKEEAKHQCMIANNVIVLRSKDIKNLSIELFMCSNSK